MLRISLDGLEDSGTILCLGAHCDDVEIGCGATLVDLAERFPGIRIHVIVFCSDERREAETRRSLARLLDENSNITHGFATFRDGYVPYQAAEVKEFLVKQASGIEPGLVITHSRQDLHQDHRFVSELTYQIFRDSLILEMEIPKYDGDMGRPNVYSPISANAAKRKIETLIECYESQSEKHWFSEEVFMGLIRLRGLECRSPSGLAEAFYVSKMVLV